MAKAKPKTEVAVVAGNSALPAFLANYKGPMGTETIGADDVSIPRIKLAQSMTPEVKAGKMKEGALFLNVTGEVLAEPGDKLEFVPIVQGKEYILWRDRNDNGGGIFARARRVVDKGRARYEWDKQNQSFETKVGGKVKVKWTTGRFVDEDRLGEWGSEVPNDKESGIAATAHFNYVVFLPKSKIFAALSLSRSAVKRAKDFNAILKMSDAPIFARKFAVMSKPETNDNGTFANYAFEPAGFVQSETEFEQYKAAAAGFAEKGYTVDQSDEDQDAPDTAAKKKF